MEVTITREQLYKSPNRNARFAWKWLYRTVGPDGTRFDNDSIVTLRALLKRRYGRGIVIIEPWNS